MAQFTNQAQLTYNNTVTNSNIAIGEVIGALTASKTPVTDTYSQGDSITYIVNLVYTASSALNGLTLTDDLGAYELNNNTIYPLTYTEGSVKYFVNGVLQPTPTVNSDTVLIISGINVPADSNVAIVYEATANQYAPLTEGSAITNTATISGCGITPIEASATITATNGPLLTITKAISPIPVSENGTVTYTFTIQNLGNTDAVATDNVTLTDVFNPILTNVSVSFNGVSWQEGVNYTYNETSGEFETVAGQVTVGAGQYVQDPTTGEWVLTEATSTLVITGNIGSI